MQNSKKRSRRQLRTNFAARSLAFEALQARLPLATDSVDWHAIVASVEPTSIVGLSDVVAMSSPQPAQVQMQAADASIGPSLNNLSKISANQLPSDVFEVGFDELSTIDGMDGGIRTESAMTDAGSFYAPDWMNFAVAVSIASPVDDSVIFYTLGDTPTIEALVQTIQGSNDAIEFGDASRTDALVHSDSQTPSYRSIDSRLDSRAMENSPSSLRHHSVSLLNGQTSSTKVGSTTCEQTECIQASQMNRWSLDAISHGKFNDLWPNELMTAREQNRVPTKSKVSRHATDNDTMIGRWRSVSEIVHGFVETVVPAGMLAIGSEGGPNYVTPTRVLATKVGGFVMRELFLCADRSEDGIVASPPQLESDAPDEVAVKLSNRQLTISLLGIVVLLHQAMRPRLSQENGDQRRPVKFKSIG